MHELMASATTQHQPKPRILIPNLTRVHTDHQRAEPAEVHTSKDAQTRNPKPYLRITRPKTSRPAHGWPEPTASFRLQTLPAACTCVPGCHRMDSFEFRDGNPESLLPPLPSPPIPSERHGVIANGTGRQCSALDSPFLVMTLAYHCEQLPQCPAARLPPPGCSHTHTHLHHTTLTDKCQSPASLRTYVWKFA